MVLNTAQLITNTGIGPDRVMVEETGVYRSDPSGAGERLIAGSYIPRAKAVAYGIVDGEEIVGTPVDGTDPNVLEELGGRRPDPMDGEQLAARLREAGYYLFKDDGEDAEGEGDQTAAADGAGGGQAQAHGDGEGEGENPDTKQEPAPEAGGQGEGGTATKAEPAPATKDDKK
jgi:hypothetical protein